MISYRFELKLASSTMGFSTFKVAFFLFIFIQLHDCVSSSKLDTKGILDLLINEFITCRCRCGLPNREGRMRGGEYLKKNEFPWLVTVRTKNKSINGVLINNKYVLTAATPLTEYTPYDIKVTLGHHDICNSDISSFNASVDSLLIHPDYSASNRAHDLALLRLSNVVLFEKRINPICMPTVGTNYLGQVGTVLGWTEERTPEGDAISSCRPRKLGLPILGNDECVVSVVDPQFLTSDKGCVGVVGGPSYVCSNDVGGVVMYRNTRGIYELIGIFTDKNECGIRLNTAIYTKVNRNLNWIKHQTQDACYCSKF